MSKVVKGIKKGVKKVGKFVKKNWKPILAVGAAAFTGGMSMMGGFGGVASAIGSQGILGGIGSTMLAGAQGIMGSLGIGGGLSAGLAGKLGLTAGSTLMNSGVIGGLLGKTAAGAGAGAMQSGLSTLPGITPGAAASMTQGAGAAMGGAGGASMNAIARSAAAGGGGGGGGGGGLLQSLAPYALQFGGQYLAARGAEEAAEPEAMWGVNLQSGNHEAHQPWGTPNYVDSSVAAQRPGGRPPMIDYRNTGPYGG